MKSVTSLRGRRHRMMRIAGDSDAVFAEAIGRGVLSEDLHDPNFAGHYMYMFHDAHDTAWFKHRDNRAYVRVAPCKGPAAGSRAAVGSRPAPCNGIAPCKGSAPCKGFGAGSGSDERGAVQP